MKIDNWHTRTISDICKAAFCKFNQGNFFDQINLNFEILHSIIAQSQLWNRHRKIQLNEVELHPSSSSHSLCLI